MVGLRWLAVVLLVLPPGGQALGLGPPAILPEQPTNIDCPRYYCGTPFAVGGELALLRTGIYVHEPGTSNWTRAPSSPDLTEAAAFATDGSTIAYALQPATVVVGHLDNGTYVQDQVLEPARHYGFGMSLGVEGDWLLVGEAWGITTDDQQRLQNIVGNDVQRPYVRSFHRQGRDWVEVPVDGLATGYDNYVDIALRSGRAVVSHWIQNYRSTLVEVLELQGNQWSIVHTYASPEALDVQSVDIGGNLAVVGTAEGGGLVAATNDLRRDVHVLERVDGQWRDGPPIAQPPGRASFGWQAAVLADDLVAVAWMDANQTEHSVDLFQRRGDTWNLVHTAFVEHKDPNDFSAGNPYAQALRLASTDHYLVTGTYWKSPRPAYIYEVQVTDGAATLVPQHVQGGAGLDAEDAAAIAAGLGFLALLAYLVRSPLGAFFTRLLPNRVLKNPLRRWIVEQVTASPGVHFNRLAQRAGKGRGAMRYHLDVLLRERILVEHRVGRHVSYALPGVAMDAKIEGRRRSGLAARVLTALSGSEGSTVSAMAAEIGASYGSVLYHLRRLQEVGAVRIENSSDGLRAFRATDTQGTSQTT